MNTLGTAAEWDLIVPDNGAELMAEFRRHGVLPGQRVHVAVGAGGIGSEPSETLAPFFNSFDGPADLAERSSAILQAEFPSGS